MYLNILKKDLKRKKTMNFILLIFIAMASMFVSSSANNMVTILNATDYYFEKAELKDYFVLTEYEEQNEEKIQKFLQTNKYVENYDSAEFVMSLGENWEKENGKALNLDSISFLMAYDATEQKFFDSDDKEIKEIKENEIYIPRKAAEKNKLEKGDIIYLCNEEEKVEFKVAGIEKDALLGSEMMGATRMLVSDRGYEKVKEVSSVRGMLHIITSNHVEKLENDFNQEDIHVVFNGNRDLIKMTYVMSMVVAGVLLVLSVCLILISLVILRFTIVFTLKEEFREIGVMKAIGISQGNIRGIYMVKYLAISIVGAGIGFAGGIPFGKVILDSVSQNIVMDSIKNTWSLNLACALLVVLIVMLFCYRSTGRVKKFSPIDAIRNGSNGERFTKKGFLKLEKWHGNSVSFMAINDIFTQFRSFIMLLVIFTIGMLLITVHVNTVNTLSGEKLAAWFGMKEADLYVVNEEKDNQLMHQGGRTEIEKSYADMEKVLKQHGISASISQEIAFKLKVSYKDKSYNALCIQGNRSSTKEYTYEEGTPPMYDNEIAITEVTANHIGAKLGDTVTITTGGIEKDYLITAYFQSMNNMGEGIRFSEKAEIDYSLVIGSFARQLVYKDKPSQKEQEIRKETIEELFPEYKVKSCEEYIKGMTGGIAETLDYVKQFVIVVVMAINILVSILVSKTLLTRERGEIGMLKAIGFGNTSLICWQVLRIGVILVLAVILGAFLSEPIAQISSGKVFEMMGATHIEFVVKPIEVYIIYPLMMLIATLAGALISAQQVRSISAQKTNNIE